MKTDIRTIVTLTYNLDNPEDRLKYVRATSSYSLLNSIKDIQQLINTEAPDLSRKLKDILDNNLVFMEDFIEEGELK